MVSERRATVVSLSHLRFCSRVFAQQVCLLTLVQRNETFVSFTARLLSLGFWANLVYQIFL